MPLYGIMVATIIQLITPNAVTPDQKVAIPHGAYTKSSQLKGNTVPSPSPSPSPSPGLIDCCPEEAAAVFPSLQLRFLLVAGCQHDLENKQNTRNAHTSNWPTIAAILIPIAIPILNSPIPDSIPLPVAFLC